MRPAFCVALVLGVVGTASPSHAQTPPQAAPADAAPPGGSGPATESAPKASSNPAAGYAYSDHVSVSHGGGGHTHYRQRGPAVNTPGFEETLDGGSRLFVQLTQSVPVEERKAAGSITYVLKGASPRVWNNTNALVTVHFNTPISRARLVPQGKDLLFIVELRAASTPTWKVTEASDRSAQLTIDFPKGDFTGAAGEVPSADATSAEGAPTPAARPAPATPKARSGERKGGSRGAPTNQAPAGSAPKP